MDRAYPRNSPVFRIIVEGLGYDVKLHPAVTLYMWGNVRLPLSQLPPHLQGYEDATTWVAELDGNHLQTDGLVF